MCTDVQEVIPFDFALHIRCTQTSNTAGFRRLRFFACGEGDASHNLNDFTEGGSRPRCWNWRERFGSDFLHIFTLLKLPFFYQPRLLRRNSFEQLAGGLITWIDRKRVV